MFIFDKIGTNVVMHGIPPALQIAAEHFPPGEVSRSESGELFCVERWTSSIKNSTDDFAKFYFCWKEK